MRLFIPLFLLLLGGSSDDSVAQTRSVTLLGGFAHPIEYYEPDSTLGYTEVSQPGPGTSFLLELAWSRTPESNLATLFYLTTRRWSEPGYSRRVLTASEVVSTLQSRATVETRLVGVGKRFSRTLHERVALAGIAGVEAGHWTRSALTETRSSDNNGRDIVSISGGSPASEFGVGTSVGMELQARANQGVFLVVRASWRFSITSHDNQTLWNLQDYQAGFRFAL